MRRVKSRKLAALFVFLLVISNILTYFLARNKEAEISTGNESDGFSVSAEAAGNEEALPLFREVLEIIQNYYIEEVDINKLEEGAIKGMLEILEDPQTNFLSRESMEDMLLQTMGSYGGLGIHIANLEEYVVIISPIRGTPGEKAGLLAGDLIQEIDGENIEGFSANEVALILRGTPGEPVTLKVKREGIGELEFMITREIIELDSVYAELLSEGIGYIYISNFDDTTGKEFSEALDRLEGENISGLILDLRDNPGGILTEAIRVAEAIVPAGPIAHVVDGEDKILETYYSRQEEKPYPIVTLVNGYSASAAEILAGALQDSGGGLLVGTKTFGKATVQNLLDLPDKMGLRYTVAKYLTPAGRNIHGEGLEPDYVIELPAFFQLPFYALPADEGLKKEDSGEAVEILKEMLRALDYDSGYGNYFDAKMETALRLFQRDNGLAPTGRFSPETHVAVCRKMEDLLARFDTQLEKALAVVKGH